MADETITVNLESGTYPPWVVTFPNGGNFTVGPGDTDTINWVLGTAPSGAAISAVTFSNGQPGDVPWAGAVPSAPNWSTTDTNNLQAGDPAVSWAYTVTVTYDNVPYVSDPQITNPPPTG